MDPVITAGIISAGSNILGNVLNRQSTQDANQQNIELARENRAWQEDMSNTAHQREMADLKAANLNPILAAGGGASTPGGDSATVEAPQVQMPSVIEIAQLNEAMKNNQSTRELQAAQAEQIRTQTKRDQVRGELGSDLNKIYKKVKSSDLIQSAIKMWEGKQEKQKPPQPLKPGWHLQKLP